MKLGIVMLLAMLPILAQKAPQSYWGNTRSDGRSWCGYSDSTAFHAAADTLSSSETARVTYSDGVMTELIDQVTPESGDWIVIDRYTPTSARFQVRRTILLAQEQLQVVQQGVLDGTTRPVLRTTSVTTSRGKKAKLGQADVPDVPVRNRLSQFGFLRLVERMRSQNLSRLCQ